VGECQRQLSDRAERQRERERERERERAPVKGGGLTLWESVRGSSATGLRDRERQRERERASEGWWAHPLRRRGRRRRRRWRVFVGLRTTANRKYKSVAQLVYPVMAWEAHRLNFSCTRTVLILNVPIQTVP
jgi:hypothetical protein